MLELEGLTHATPVSFDWAALRQEMRQRLSDAQSLLGQELPQARQILRKVLTEPAECRAVADGGQPAYRITLTCSYAPFLPSLLIATQVASPTGFEPVLPA